MNKIFLQFLILLVLIPLVYSPPSRKVVVVEVRRRIDEGAFFLVSEGVKQVSEGDLLVVVLDTYGGYLYSMDKIIESISKLKCRKVVWIPPGGKAVSAGAIISLSFDEIYMGSETVIGACEPRPSDEKVIEYVKARIRALAERKGLNSTVIRLLEEMVEKNKSFTVNEASKLGFVKRAETLEEVLSYEGFKGVSVTYVREGLLAEVLGAILDPGIASMMLIIGIMLILMEIKATGFQGWGVIGGLLLALALYAYGIVGVNFLALTLVAIGIFLIILELKKPGIQVFGVAGLTLLALSLALQYYGRPYINFWQYIPTITFVTIFIAAFILMIIVKAGEVIRLKKSSLEERLKGKVGIAKTDITAGGRGVVHVDGEDWTATSSVRIVKGEKVRVVRVEGIILVVEKA
ncbi:MAG TPA: hypothetical protein ENF87_02855 [Thermoproteales archaeon]|nr:hypothetical protein [Thermoproteales archaeon]